MASTNLQLLKYTVNEISFALNENYDFSKLRSLQFLSINSPKKNESFWAFILYFAHLFVSLQRKESNGSATTPF